MNYLFDTNTIIYFLGKIVLSDKALHRIDSICAKGSNLSIITKLELLGYRFDNVENERPTKKFVSSSCIYQIDTEMEVETIKLRKATRMKLPDAIIAATAIVNDFTLISANTKDCRQIHHLKLLDPFGI